MSETWLPVPGYEDRYEVSDQGRVRSLLSWWASRPAPRLLAQGINMHGYPMVRLCHESGRCRNFRVHRLVLLAFVGSLPDGMETRHLDGEKRNNRLSNLVYGTGSENQTDNVRLGVHPSTRKTHCPSGHAYDETNTEMRTTGQRRCRTCHRAQEAARRRHLRATA